MRCVKCTVYSGECGVWSVECECRVWSGMRCVKCGVWCVKCGGQSVECKGECGVRYSKCGG